MELTLNNSLLAKKRQILSKWQSLAMSSYASHNLLNGKTGTGRFTDPISYVTIENTTRLYDLLISEVNDVDYLAPLEEICRLRAVQDIQPSSALSFIPALKQLVREELADEIGKGLFSDELENLDKHIDNINAMAVNTYSGCIARINQVRINEMKRLNGRDAG
jgi:hypothetical protein